MQAKQARHRSGGRRETPEVGVIIGEHPLEEAARELGINLAETLRCEGVRAEVFRVPEELTYLHQLPPVFRAFERGEIGEDCLKANLMYNTPNREATAWINEQAASNPGVLFYRTHNFVARYHGRDKPAVGWGDHDLYGWCDTDKLRVRAYGTEEEAGSFIPNLVRRFYEGQGITREDIEGSTCHIIAAREGGHYNSQQGDRTSLRPVDFEHTHAMKVNAGLIEAPGLVTHFRGQPAPAMSDADVAVRFMMNPHPWGSEDGLRRAFGITRSVGDPSVYEELMATYLFRWGVFDREINRRVGLTGENVVRPLAEFIKDELRQRQRLTQ